MKKTFTCTANVEVTCPGPASKTQKLKCLFGYHTYIFGYVMEPTNFTLNTRTRPVEVFVISSYIPAGQDCVIEGECYTARKCTQCGKIEFQRFPDKIDIVEENSTLVFFVPPGGARKW